jgi:Dynamin central region
MVNEIIRLPAVKDLVKEQVLNVIQQARDKAEEGVNELLDSEINYIFTNDGDFLIGQGTVP